MLLIFLTSVLSSTPLNAVFVETLSSEGKNISHAEIIGKFKTVYMTFQSKIWIQIKQFPFTDKGTWELSFKPTKPNSTWSSSNSLKHWFYAKNPNDSEWWRHSRDSWKMKKTVHQTTINTMAWLRNSQSKLKKHPSDQHFAINTKFVIWLHCLVLP